MIIRLKRRVSYLKMSFSDFTKNQFLNIERTFNKIFVFHNVRVNLSRSHVFVSEQLLNRANVVMIFKQMCSKTVAKRMTISVFYNFDIFHQIFDCFLNRRRRSIMSAHNPVFTSRRHSDGRKNILPFQSFPAFGYFLESA